MKEKPYAYPADVSPDRLCVGQSRVIVEKAASVATCLTLAWALFAPTAALAVDGCLVLLCFAAPSWRSVPQCVPPIRQVLRDLSRGKSFPSCAMAGAGTSANHAWARAPGNCPPQYTRVHESESGSIYTCDYSGAVSVSIDGKPFARTWWNMGDDTVTEFSPAAKVQLGSWDTRFDDEYALWRSAQPPAPPADTGY